MSVLQLASSLDLFGRQAQFQQLTSALANDGDLLIAGVPGSGRRTLVRRAAQEVGAKVLEVDCIRATDKQRFVQLLCEGMNQTFKSAASLAVVEEWLDGEAKDLFIRTDYGRFKPQHFTTAEEQWFGFKLLIGLPQKVAETIKRQIVVILHGFPHIRSWDRTDNWESFLRNEIKIQTAVSYVLVATLAEINPDPTKEDANLEIIRLNPVADEIVAAWVQGVLHQVGLTFDPRSQALNLFLNAVQGHIGDATALVRRLSCLRVENQVITEQEVEQTIQELLSDLSTIFESVLVLLPANQAHLLECLALDPTDKPQSRAYINKHYLARGGSLQGAIAGLQHKGLIYGAELGYKIALPLFALWLRQRLS